MIIRKGRRKIRLFDKKEEIEEVKKKEVVEVVKKKSVKKGKGAK